MKINDRVWCTATAQQLYDMGYDDNQRTFMLHTYGMIKGESDGKYLVTYHMWCNREEGHDPVAVVLDKQYWKFADLPLDYIKESEEHLTGAWKVLCPLPEETS